MLGMAMSAIMITDAAITPTHAARMVPIMIVAIASPPRNGPKARCRPEYRRSAEPDFSTIMPMNTNMGTARKT